MVRKEEVRASERRREEGEGSGGFTLRIRCSCAATCLCKHLLVDRIPQVALLREEVRQVVKLLGVGAGALIKYTYERRKREGG